MADTWLSDVGIRVTDFERSIAFYTTLLDLEELKRVADSEAAYVLFRDRRSGQRLELNWYAVSNPFWTPYVPGEGLDHIEVRVRSLPEMLHRLREMGIMPVTRKLWVNAAAVQARKSDPEAVKEMEQDVWTSVSGDRVAFRVAYISDPDGNMIALYDHPEEPWDGPIPDHY
jgi:catechol 2,3-dioxygenase-like lactoylglutathione lyase family enzyme